MIFPRYPRRQTAHAPWTPEEVRRLRFVRWAVLRLKLTDGESDGQLVDFRRFHHVRLPGDAPRDWDTDTVRAFEAGRLGSASRE